MKAVQGNVSTLLERKALSETERKMGERMKRNSNDTMNLSKLKQKTNNDQAERNTRAAGRLANKKTNIYIYIHTENDTSRTLPQLFEA